MAIAVFQDAAALAAHATSESAMRFERAVAPLLAAPSVTQVFSSLEPACDGQ